MGQVQVERVATVDPEERETLQKPADQISLSSADSIDPDDDHGPRTTETVV